MTRLANALAYALMRGQAPDETEGPREYAERLAPLILESGYLPEVATREPLPVEPDLRAAVEAMFAEEQGICIDCGVVQGHDPDCLTLPVRAILARLAAPVDPGDARAFSPDPATASERGQELLEVRPVDPGEDVVEPEPWSDEWKRKVHAEKHADLVGQCSHPGCNEAHARLRLAALRPEYSVSAGTSSESNSITDPTRPVASPNGGGSVDSRKD